MSQQLTKNCLPADFQRALQQSGLFLFFTECAYVHRAGYLSWIGAAVRPATRRKRIRQSVMRLLEQRSEVFVAARRTVAEEAQEMQAATQAVPAPASSRRCA